MLRIPDGVPMEGTAGSAELDEPSCNMELPVTMDLAGGPDGNRTESCQNSPTMGNDARTNSLHSVAGSTWSLHHRHVLPLESVVTSDLLHPSTFVLS